MAVLVQHRSSGIRAPHTFKATSVSAWSLLQADTFSLNSKELPALPSHNMAGNSKLLHGQQQVDPEWEIPPAALSLGTVLGEGEFGIVHKGRWNGTPVAIKV